MVGANSISANLRLVLGPPGVAADLHPRLLDGSPPLAGLWASGGPLHNSDSIDLRFALMVANPQASCLPEVSLQGGQTFRG
jgi:hypothetical protein